MISEWESSRVEHNIMRNAQIYNQAGPVCAVQPETLHPLADQS